MSVLERSKLVGIFYRVLLEKTIRGGDDYSANIFPPYLTYRLATWKLPADLLPWLIVL